MRDSGDRSSPPCGEMSSEKPVSAPPGSATSLTDTDRDSHPPPGSVAPQPQVAASAGCAPAAERMVSAAGSMVLPAGVINPTVPIRNIHMKFAVLVGLIQVGEVSNRDIVETVLNLVSRRRMKQPWEADPRSFIPICFIYDSLTPIVFQRMMSFVCSGGLLCSFSPISADEIAPARICIEE